MTVRFVQWTMDVQDVELMAGFWSAALGYRAELGGDGCGKLSPPDGAPRDVPTVWLQATAEPKRGKNRDHPDLRPLDGDVEAEVERLLALGARSVDVGQTDDDPFVVLADPEGNEFCVLRREPRAADRSHGGSGVPWWWRIRQRPPERRHSEVPPPAGRTDLLELRVQQLLQPRP